jgi:O-acetylhomoserine/O-acetylserine sulfhydrylase
MALLEGGAAAVATSSGQAAQFMAILAIASAGDNIITSSYLYGGTYNQFKGIYREYSQVCLTNPIPVFFKKIGITVKFVPGTATAEDYAQYIDDKTKAIYTESIGNPKYHIADIPSLAKV